VHFLCFDGASKGNPRVESVEGIILDPGGNLEIKCAWSLGQENNNQVEVYALLKGVQLAKGLQLQQLIIVGESNNTIWRFIKGAPPNFTHPINIIKKMKFEIESIPKVSFYHVKRENNCLDDSQANIAVSIPKGVIIVNESLYQNQIP
jgi:ribonuclease HI